MALEFDFVPHDINNIFQNIKHTTAYSRHLLIHTGNQYLWGKLLSIDPYSLCINRNDSINIVINILQVLKHYVPFYAQQHKLKDNELLDLVCKQKRGKICLYNNWEAWPAETYLNILNVLCSRYKEWNLQEVDFIISSCNELLTSGNNVTHAVNSNLMPLATFDNAIQEKIIKGIEKKEHRKNKFICLNMLVSRFERLQP